MTNFNKSIKIAYETSLNFFHAFYFAFIISVSFSNPCPLCFIRTIFTTIFIWPCELFSIFYNKRFATYLANTLDYSRRNRLIPFFPQAIALRFSSAFKRTKFSTIFSCPPNFKLFFTYNTTFYYPRMISSLFNFHEEIISFFRSQVERCSLPLAHIYLEKE